MARSGDEWGQRYGFWERPAEGLGSSNGSTMPSVVFVGPGCDGGVLALIIACECHLTQAQAGAAAWLGRHNLWVVATVSAPKNGQMAVSSLLNFTHMNIKTLGLLAAASLATVACSQEKKVETTTTTTVTDPNTAGVLPDTMAAHDEARRLAARVAEDLKLTDTVVVTRIEKTYYTRGRRLGELHTRYTTDTTGRYLAVRQVNDQADSEVRTALNNPAYYNTYSANRASYGEGPYSLVPVRIEPTRTGTGNVGQGSGVKKMENQNDGDHKIKYENGAKVKRSDDGSIKIKRADGTKIKIDENGNRTVKKSIF